MFPPIVGGSGMYAYEIANALGKLGHNVDVYTQLKADAESTFEIHENVSVYTLTKSRRYLVTFETLYYSIRARSGVDLNYYDVIHGTLMPASTIAFSERFTFDTPIVLTSHSFAPSMMSALSAEKPADYLLKYVFHPMNSLMDNVAGRAADEIITISEEMQTQLVDQYGIPKEDTTLIPHGVNIEEYKPTDEIHPAVSDEKLTLLFVGRLSPINRPSLALQSLAKLQRTNIDIELLIAGAGRLENKLKQQMRELQVADQVQFLGYVNRDLPVLYSSADLTLFTPRYTGFGLVFLESMATGTPVVGVPEGGFPDIVEDEVSGYICQPNRHAFADRIETLAGDPKRLASMSQAAREAVEGRDWKDVAARVEGVYQDVIE